MAAYYVSGRGSRGSIHRLGGSLGGVTATVAGWRGACTIRLRDNEKGESWLTVTLGTWNGGGIERTIYNGPVNAKGKPATASKPKKAAK